MKVTRPLLLLIIALIFITAGIIFYWNSPPDNIQKTVLFSVPRGKGVNYISKKLKEKNLIRSQLLFKFLSIIFNQDKNIKSGIYEIQSDMTTFEILHILTKGNVKLVQFTIIEGWTNLQIAQYLSNIGLVESQEKFLQLTRDPKILKRYNIAGPTTEGFLYPETYTIDPQLPASTIHEIMIQMCFRQLRTIINLELISPEELYKKMIIASIIEREAIDSQELPFMASVYYNRLKKGMKLQADPTIQYILKNPKKKLTLKDLKIPSPYNTYLYKGLPPTPISNPGISAIRASFFPANTDYYYFVLMPDGKHYFSRTYSEHLKAKKKYWDTQK